MAKEAKKKFFHSSERFQRLLHTERSFGQKGSDVLTRHIGSWSFIVLFFVFMTFWIWLNVKAYINHWDPYPFILLNFVLSCLAAIQGPIILMSQNRDAERDRQNLKYDYAVNRKAELEIQKVLKELDMIKKHMYEQKEDAKKK